MQSSRSTAPEDHRLLHLLTPLSDGQPLAIPATASLIQALAGLPVFAGETPKSPVTVSTVISLDAAYSELPLLCLPASSASTQLSVPAPLLPSVLYVLYNHHRVDYKWPADASAMIDAPTHTAMPVVDPRPAHRVPLRSHLPPGVNPEVSLSILLQPAASRAPLAPDGKFAADSIRLPSSLVSHHDGTFFFTFHFVDARIKGTSLAAGGTAELRYVQCVCVDTGGHSESVRYLTIHVSYLARAAADACTHTQA